MHGVVGLFCDYSWSHVNLAMACEGTISAGSPEIGVPTEERSHFTVDAFNKFVSHLVGYIDC